MSKEEPHNLLNLGERIKVIVITGPPGGGKTTGMARLMSTLSDRGFKVIISPESATKLINAGLKPWDKAMGTLFQRLILQDTLNQEDILLAGAKEYRDAGEKVVVICDRGALDGEAYMDPGAFADMIHRFGYTYRDLCDARYHAIIHLDTAASGAEKFYTLENNKARIESPEDAIALGKRTLAAWQRHSHVRFIGSSENFEDKMQRLLAEVFGVLGEPVPLEKERKFLIKRFDRATISVKVSESTIVQDYLFTKDPREERRVRRRVDTGGASYYYTVKKYLSPGVRVEEEKLISYPEYAALLTMRDPYMKTIKKQRYCFFWKGQFIEADIFEEPAVPDAFMEVEYVDEKIPVISPPFFEVIREVTGEKQYSNFAIAIAKGGR